MWDQIWVFASLLLFKCCSSTSLALLGLRLPRHPLVHLPLQPLHLLSFSPNLLLQLPQLGVLVQTHLACLESNRSCGLGECESRLNTRSWTPVPLSLLLKLLKLGKPLCWNYPCPVGAAPMWSVGEMCWYRSKHSNKCNIKWWFWCISKNNMHFKPIFNKSPVRYDVKWNVG